MQANQEPAGVERSASIPSSLSTSIFNRSDVIDQLRPLCDDAFDLEDDWAVVRPDDAIANEDRRRFKALKALLDDQIGSRRNLIVGNDTIAENLRELRSEAPNFLKTRRYCQPSGRAFPSHRYRPSTAAHSPRWG